MKLFHDGSNMFDFIHEFHDVSQSQRASSTGMNIHVDAARAVLTRFNVTLHCSQDQQYQDRDQDQNNYFTSDLKTISNENVLLMYADDANLVVFKNPGVQFTCL